MLISEPQHTAGLLHSGKEETAEKGGKREKEGGRGEEREGEGKGQREGKKGGPVQECTW